MKINQVEILETNQTGQSVLIIRTPQDRAQHLPHLQTQVPTDLAEYIKLLIERDQAGTDGTIGIDLIPVLHHLAQPLS